MDSEIKQTKQCSKCGITNTLDKFRKYVNTNNNIFSLKLYNRDLSATEVLQNYNTTKTRFGLT